MNFLDHKSFYVFVQLKYCVIEQAFFCLKKGHMSDINQFELEMV